MTEPWTTRPITAAEAAILRHPDQRTPWAPSVVVHLPSGALPPALAAERLAALAAATPILDARLHRGGADWHAGSGRLHVESLDAEQSVLHTRFVLRDGPTVKVAVSPDGDRLAVVGHHAALDGRALLMVARGLLGAHPVEAVSPPQRMPASAEPARTEAPQAAGSEHAAASALRRIAWPAHRVAPSTPAPANETFAAIDAPADASLRVAALAAATVDATSDWNGARGAPWQRVGLTIPVGGPATLGNVSTHRRLDVTLPTSIADAVHAALAAAAPPPEAAITPARARLLTLLTPIVGRFSDSLLISNLGMVALPGALAVDFYPQARGRSAVAVGACTPVGGRGRLTLRARDLSGHDAAQLLHAVAASLRPAATR
jgi:hypothetical protein